MKKIIFLVVLMVFATNMVSAQYVRKLKEPDFFIPENSKMHMPEKLPPLKLKEPEEKDKEKKATQSGNAVDVNKLNKIPPYKNKYNEYIDDIREFYSTNKMPANQELEADLQAMNSDDKIEVTAPNPSKITSKEMGEFYNLYRKILGN